MIWNRPSNLWLGAAAAIFNVTVLVLNSYGIEVRPELIAAVNIALGAVIGLIAFQPPTINVDDTVNVKTHNGTPAQTISFDAKGNPSNRDAFMPSRSSGQTNNGNGNGKG